MQINRVAKMLCSIRVSKYDEWKYGDQINVLQDNGDGSFLVEGGNDVKLTLLEDEFEYIDNLKEHYKNLSKYT